MMVAAYRFFLGGQDLEMAEIRALLTAAGLGGQITDHNLAWGARASAYAPEIRAALAAGETPVLVELADDLDPGIDRTALIDIDHHGQRAGVNQPTALRQIFEMVGAPLGLTWTRRHALVAANDVGHVQALRAMAATPAEIRAIRDADRRAQGITAAIEQESRRAAATATRQGLLTIVRTRAPTSSAIADFLLPEYGGPGADDLLVVMPDKVSFFGCGALIAALAELPGCWYGGALPDRGYWGIALAGDAAEAIVSRICDWFRAPPQGLGDGTEGSPKDLSQSAPERG